MKGRAIASISKRGLDAAYVLQVEPFVKFGAARVTDRVSTSSTHPRGLWRTGERRPIVDRAAPLESHLASSRTQYQQDEHDHQDQPDQTTADIHLNLLAP